MSYGALASCSSSRLASVPRCPSEAAGAQAAPPKVIRLVSVNLSFRLLVDKAPLGTSKGDTIQTTNVLSNAVGSSASRRAWLSGATPVVRPTSMPFR